MIRSLSGSPLTQDMIPPESVFVGEALEVKNVRKIFAGAIEDKEKREDRVLLLLGPVSAEKSDLIDFLCNVFYGAEENGQKRYHIANEKFDSETPHRHILCYIFNDTVVSHRPVIIDTPGTGQEMDDDNVPSFINTWLHENWNIRLDAIGVVFSDLHRLTSQEEDELQKVLQIIPAHARKNIIVFITASDGSRASPALLRRFGLQDCQTFVIHTSVMLQKASEDVLTNLSRKRYWDATVAQIRNFFNIYLDNEEPVTISGQPHVDNALHLITVSNSARSSVFYESRRSIKSSYSSSSKSTNNTVIESTQCATVISHETPYSEVEMSSTTSTSVSTPSTIINTSKTRLSENFATYDLTPEPASTSSPRPPVKPPPPPPPAYTKPPLTPESPKVPAFPAPYPPKKTSTSDNVRDKAAPTPPALTNAMFETIRSQKLSDHGDEILEVNYGGGPSEYVFVHNQNPQVVEPQYMQPLSAIPDSVREYADEQTPPPVIHGEGDRYSTVAYMNHDSGIANVHTGSRSNITVRDALRLSRDDIRVVDKTQSSPADSDELRRFPSGRSAASILPKGDLPPSTQYYSTTERSYQAYGTVDRGRRWSKSSEPRSETVIADPFYSNERKVSNNYGIDIRKSRSSLHESMPELVHSENKLDVVQPYSAVKETAIDDYSTRQFVRDEASRRSRHVSEGRQHIPIERRISPERKPTGGSRGSQYSQYARLDQVNQQSYQPAPLAVKEIRNENSVHGGEVRPAVHQQQQHNYNYTQIDHNRKNTQTSVGRGVTPIPVQYDQPPLDHTPANPYIIPQSMRQGSPLQVRVHLGSKNQAMVEHVHRDGSVGYGEVRRNGVGLTEETTTTTTTTRKEEVEKRQKRREEERRRKEQQELNERNKHYNAYGLLHEEHTGSHETRYREEQKGKNIKNSGGLGWTPSNFRNPKDCFMNFLCFVFAPLVVIAIIIVIIIFFIIQ